jgi:hypothetical protein
MVASTDRICCGRGTRAIRILSAQRWAGERRTKRLQLENHDIQYDEDKGSVPVRFHNQAQLAQCRIGFAFSLKTPLIGPQHAALLNERALGT